MSGKANRKLINYSIKTKMQVRLFIKVLGVALMGITLMAVIFYFYSDREINNSFKLFHIHAQNFTEYLFPAAILSAAAATFFAILIALFLPITIAGPLYRIEKILKEDVAEGDLRIRYKLRKGDELKDLANALNLSMEKLGSRIKEISQSAKKLESTVAGQENPDKETQELTKKINEQLDHFKL
jgi:methyl-accepting chemotaxis protein